MHSIIIEDVTIKFKLILFILYIGDIDDPFIPQRGKKHKTIDYKITPFLNTWPHYYPSRLKIDNPDDITAIYSDNNQDIDNGLLYQNLNTNHNNNKKYIKSI